MKRYHFLILQSIIVATLISCNQKEPKTKTDTAVKVPESSANATVPELQSCPEPFVFPPIDSAKISINTTENGAGVSKDVNNVPVYVALNKYNFNFAKAEKNGSDLRFVKPDGSPLAFAIEQWDDSLKRAIVRVLIDTIYGNQSTQYFFMLRGVVKNIAVSNDTIRLNEALNEVKRVEWLESHQFEAQRDTLAPPDKDWARLIYPEWGDGYGIIGVEPITHTPVLSIDRSVDIVNEADDSSANFSLLLQRQMPLYSPCSAIARLKISGTALPGREYEGLSTIESIIIPEGECSIQKTIPLKTFLISGYAKTVTVTIQPDSDYIIGGECTQTITIKGKK